MLFPCKTKIWKILPCRTLDHVLSSHGHKLKAYEVIRAIFGHVIHPSHRQISLSVLLRTLHLVKSPPDKQAIKNHVVHLQEILKIL